MANDPNRDLLPVKEDSWKNGRGIYDKFDYQLLGKLSRCELEDRFLRLLDEQTHIKKLANSQEDKIKRLGTKLLRLLNEKKIGKKIVGQTKTAEELELRIIELEHENYALKDKNIVLKQQLSSHTRHPINHRSSLRSNYTSPLMTTRHPAQPPQSDTGYNNDETNNKVLNEMQLQEAEGHISELNEEIKCLHDKIDYLQKNLEKNCLDNKKVKVTENIELIRLQRALKQQAIQIACLQAQIKNSEFCQRGLKEELLKAHRENDDALQIISLKQNEILNLCSKLEENKLSRLEEDELKGRIDDLVRERDILRERSEYLIKTIGARDLDAQKICELEKALEEEKLKKEKLEEAVEVLNKDKKNTEAKYRASLTQCDEMKTVDRGLQAFCCETKNATTTIVSSEDSESLCNRCHFSIAICKCGSQDTIINQEVDTESDECETSSEKETAPKNYACDEVEKVKMKRELQYLREMLKSQTERCEAQQTEIARLMCELKINEEKCNETLKRLDFHLRIFQCLELQERQKSQKCAEEKKVVASEPVVCTQEEGKLSPPPTPPRILERVCSSRLSAFSQTTDTMIDTVRYQDTVIECYPHQTQLDRCEPPMEPPRMPIFPARKWINASTQTYYCFTSMKDATTQVEQPVVKDVGISVKLDSSLGLIGSKEYDYMKPPSKEFQIKKSSYMDDLGPKGSVIVKKPVIVEPDRMPRFNEGEKKRFVDQKFLDSSDDELKVEDSFKRDSFLSKVRNSDYDSAQRPNQSRPPEDESDSDPDRANLNSKKSKSSKYNYTYSNTSLRDSFEEEDYILVGVQWLKVEPESSLWMNSDIEMLFVDFTFLDLRGAETETPQSLAKPLRIEDACEFNFIKRVEMTPARRKLLNSLLKNPNDELITFKVVSDSEKFDETSDECEDVGVASVPVKDFLHYCNKGPFRIAVRNVKDPREQIAILGVKFEATQSLLIAKK